MGEKVVILVDNKKRDLPGCALIAHHLETGFGINCVLEPLESWRACIAAYKPNFILFNHLTAMHLVRFSHRLKEMGVLVGVLPNEGISYDSEVLDYNAGRYHSDAHIDHFFCWNKAHQDALVRNLKNFDGEIHVVGVPRFDYYFAPWKDLFFKPQEYDRRRPRILICTNFVFARYQDWPKPHVDKIFSPWKDRISAYANYRDLIEVCVRSRSKIFQYLEAILRGTKCNIDLKPHPSENHKPYLSWFEKLPLEYKARVKVCLTELIWEVLPLCDLEISCERCTTALESWILGKPTIELVFEKHPRFFDELSARPNRLCDSPKKLPAMIEETLKNPVQEDLQKLRRQHLDEWCAAPSGISSRKIAEIIAEAIGHGGDPKWNFTLQDWRRALKLKIKNFLGLAYGSNPWKLIMGLLPGQQMDPTEAKFIRPTDVREWRERLQKIHHSGTKHSNIKCRGG